MRSFSLLTLLLLGCGPAAPPCESPYVGTWSGTTVADTLTLDASCRYFYVGSDGCRTVGNYSAPISPQGSVLVNINTATPGNCLQDGKYVCYYSASPMALTFNCGAGTFNYYR